MKGKLLQNFPFLEGKKLVENAIKFTLILQLAEMNQTGWFSIPISRAFPDPLNLSPRSSLLFQLKYLGQFASKIFDGEYLKSVDRLLGDPEDKTAREKYLISLENVLESPLINTGNEGMESPDPILVLPGRSGYLKVEPFLKQINGKLYYICGSRHGELIYCYEGKQKLAKNDEAIISIGHFLLKSLFLTGASRLLSEAETRVLEQGWEYFLKGKLEEAAGLLEIARGKYGDFPSILFLLGSVYRRMGSQQDLERIAKRMVELYPRLDRSYEVLSWHSQTINAESQTRAALRKGEKLNPNNRYFKRRLHEMGSEEYKEENFIFVMNGLEYEEIIGREREIQEIFEALNCKYKNNVLIVGEDGVGKTAIVEEIVRRIDEGSVPEHLAGRRIFKLNFAKSIAGTKFRGQFEERILNVLKKVKEQNGILFMDDIHFLLSPSFSKGAGLDIAGVLLPEMEKGFIQIIATTSFTHINDLKENAPSFIRRMQIIKINEIHDSLMEEILERKKESIELHHGVIIPSSLMPNIVELAHLYLPEKKLPEMAIDIMDRASSKVAVDFARKGREFPEITLEDLQRTVSEMSGLPEDEIKTSSMETVKDLEKRLKMEIVGQDEAIEKIARVIRTAKLGMDIDSRRPDGVFLFVGPTGVGKTETARALARVLFGNEKRLVRIDMSQLMEKHAYSELVGAPPGYVGYYDQNQLTDRIIAQPNSIILLDEVEKAHPMVLNVFLQVFDAGRLTDGRGRTAYFNHATVIMTSNIGTDLYFKSKVGFEWTRAERSEIMQEIKNYFSPEFLNRIDEIVFFRPLDIEDIKKIIDLQLREVRRRLALEEKSLVLTEKVKTAIAKRGYSREYGARRLARTIREMLLDKLAVLKLSEEWSAIKTIFAEEDHGEIILRTSREPVVETQETELEKELKGA